MSDEYAKSEEMGCSVFLLLGLIVLVVWATTDLIWEHHKDHCAFERNVAVAIHNGHIITKGCKVIPR